MILKIFLFLSSSRSGFLAEKQTIVVRLALSHKHPNLPLGAMHHKRSHASHFALQTAHLIRQPHPKRHRSDRMLAPPYSSSRQSVLALHTVARRRRPLVQHRAQQEQRVGHVAFLLVFLLGYTARSPLHHLPPSLRSRQRSRQTRSPLSTLSRASFCPHLLDSASQRASFHYLCLPGLECRRCTRPR